MVKVIYTIIILFLSISAINAQIPSVKIPKVKLNSQEAENVFVMDTIALNTQELIVINEMPIFWTKNDKISVQGSEVAFSNWNGGGANSISLLLGLDFNRNYKDKNFKWDSQIIIRAGANKQSDEDIRKTEDRLELNSKAGFSFKKNSNWYYLGQLNFTTQFFNGFNFPNTTDIISQFMAPGYLLAGFGVEHKIKAKKFYMYLSPMTYKSTFVLNQDLANDGAFGVKAAVRNENGDIIEEGDKIRLETGVLINSRFEKEVFSNINLENRLSLYTDYINNFGNVDVDWEVNINFRVNDFISASFGSHIRYDDDVKIRIEQEDGSFVQGGARIQWKQQLGIGVVIEL